MLAQGIEGVVTVQGFNLAGATGADLYLSASADANITAKVTASTATQLTLDVTVNAAAAWGLRTLVVHTGASGDSTSSPTPTNQFEVSMRTGAITTVAGDGFQGYAGDNGPAVFAKLDAPRGLAFGKGIVFVADSGNHCVRAFRVGTVAPPAGLPLAAKAITTVAGTCGTSGSSGDGAAATAAQMKTPAALGYDTTRDLLFIADQADNRVRVVNLGAAAVTLGAASVMPGAIAAFAGTGSPGFAGDAAAATSAELTSPQGLYVDGNGTVIIADTGNGRVRAVATSAQTLPQYAGVALTPFQIITIAGNGSGTPIAGGAQQVPLAQPTGLTGDGTLLYIADKAAKQILAVNLDVAVHTLYNGTTTVGPGNLAIIAGAGTTVGTFTSPNTLTADPAGGVHVVDGVTSQVTAIATGVDILYRAAAKVFPGTAAPIAGSGTAGYTGDYGPAAAAQLSGPLGAVLNAGGTRLYVADTANNVVREVSLAYDGPFFDGTLGPLNLGPGTYTLSTDTGWLYNATATVSMHTGVSDGVFNFGDITISAGATLTVSGSQRFFLTSSGMVQLSGSIVLAGAGATTSIATLGFGTAGTPGTCGGSVVATYGTPQMPNLEGGDNGIGAILVAAVSDVSIDGTITATGAGAPMNTFFSGGTGGGIKVVSTSGSVTVGGSLQALGGTGQGTCAACRGGACGANCSGNCCANYCTGGNGGEGRIRIEANGTALIAGATITPAASVGGNIAPVVTGL
jgi:hypothetical protein